MASVVSLWGKMFHSMREAIGNMLWRGALLGPWRLGAADAGKELCHAAHALEASGGAGKRGIDGRQRLYDSGARGGGLHQ